MVAATLPQSLPTIVHQALLHFFNALYRLKIPFRCIDITGNILGQIGIQQQAQYSRERS